MNFFISIFFIFGFIRVWFAFTPPWNIENFFHYHPIRTSRMK